MADDVRGELAAALMDARLIRWREPELALEFADALLPVVDRIARERAAEELRAAAEVAFGFRKLREANDRIAVVYWLRGRADALDAEAKP